MKETIIKQEKRGIENMINHPIAAEKIGLSATLMALHSHVEYASYCKKLTDFYSDIKKKNNLKSTEELMQLAVAELFKEKGGITTVLGFLSTPYSKMNKEQRILSDAIIGDLKLSLIQRKEKSNSEYIDIFQEEVYDDLQTSTKGKSKIVQEMRSGKRNDFYSVGERMLEISRKKEEFLGKDSIFRAANLSLFEEEIQLEINSIAKEMDILVGESGVVWAEFKQTVLAEMEKDSDYMGNKTEAEAHFFRKVFKKTLNMSIQNNFITQRTGIGKKILESSLSDGLQLEVDTFKERMFLQEGKDVVLRDMDMLVNVNIISKIEKNFSVKMSDSDRTGILKLGDVLRGRIDSKEMTSPEYSHLILMLITGKSNQIESVIKDSFSEDIRDGVMALVEEEIVTFRKKRVYNRTEKFGTPSGMGELMSGEMEKFSRDFFSGNNSAMDGVNKEKEYLNDLARVHAADGKDSLYYMTSTTKTKEEINEELFEVAIGSIGDEDKEKNLFQIYETEAERLALAKKIIQMFDGFIARFTDGNKEESDRLLSMPLSELLNLVSNSPKSVALVELNNALTNSGYMRFMKELVLTIPAKIPEGKRGKDLVTSFDNDVTYGRVSVKMDEYLKINEIGGSRQIVIEKVIAEFKRLREEIPNGANSGSAGTNVDTVINKILLEARGDKNSKLGMMSDAESATVRNDIKKIVLDSEKEMTLEDFLYNTERKTSSFVQDTVSNEDELRRRAELVENRLQEGVKSGNGKRIVIKGSNAYSEPKLYDFFQEVFSKISDNNMPIQKKRDIWADLLEKALEDGLAFNIDDFGASVKTTLTADSDTDFNSMVEIASLVGTAGEKYKLITKNKLMAKYLTVSGRSEDINGKLISDQNVGDGLSYLKVANEHNIDQYKNLINSTRAFHMMGYKEESVELKKVFKTDVQIEKAKGGENVNADLNALVNFGDRSEVLIKDGERLTRAWGLYASTESDKTNKGNRNAIKSYFIGDDEGDLGPKEQILNYIFHLNDMLVAKGRSKESVQQLSLNFELMAMVKNVDAVGKKQELGSILSAINTNGGIGVQKYLNVWANTNLRSKDGVNIKKGVDETRAGFIRYLHTYESANRDTKMEKGKRILQNAVADAKEYTQKPI